MNKRQLTTKILWKLLLGSAVSYLGYMAVHDQLAETALTGAAVIGIALIAVGVTVLAGMFD